MHRYVSWAFSIGPKCVDASDFTSVDVDGDGIISAAEFRAHVGDFGIAKTLEAAGLHPQATFFVKETADE